MRGNLADLAALQGMPSEPTLRKWIAAEPDQDWIIKRGSNGDAYEIDLPGAVAAWRAREQAATQAAREKSAALTQLGLKLGLSGADEAALVLSIGERKQLLEEELVAIKIAQARRELVSRASVEGAFADVLVRDRQRRSTFASRLAKKIDLTREQLAAIERLSLADQADFARMLKDWGKDLGDSPDGAEPSHNSAAPVAAAAA